MFGNGLGSHAMRYIMVGGIVLGLDFLTYLAVLAGFPHDYLWANFSGKAVGAIAGFVLHRTITFRWRQRDPMVRQAFSYLAVFCGNLLMSSTLLWVMANFLGVNLILAKVFVDAIVISTAFLLSRFWVYRPDTGAR